jgi:hypothetical protein
VVIYDFDIVGVAFAKCEADAPARRNQESASSPPPLGEDRVRSTCFPAAERVRVRREFLCSINVIWPVQSRAQKYFA